MNGKGSSPRPLSVSAEEFDRRWRDTFGGKRKKTRRERDEADRVMEQIRATEPEFAARYYDKSTARQRRAGGAGDGQAKG